MKRDGRTFDYKTLEAIRLMAIEREREGRSPREVIASYGFCRTTIYKWLRKVRGHGHGMRGLLSSKKQRGRPLLLTRQQERLELHYQPKYAPELNPDELVWNYMKSNGTSKRQLFRGESLNTRIETDLLHLQHCPSLIRSFFHEPHVAYLAGY